ncbi:MAG: ASKHA domain-containing protein [Bacillota bacterium]
MSAAAFALDVGTTTIEGSLLDLSSGTVVGRGERLNPQAAYGSDVMTRLTLALRSRETALAMQKAVLAEAAGLLRALCETSGTLLTHVQSGVLVGNTAMHHLALGLDVSTLATAPYVPTYRRAAITELPGLPAMYCAPLIASYVGSDAVAAAIFTGLPGGATRMLIDLGTNTEVLLWHGETLFAASAPAGPAFEGAEIGCGMRARAGAIDSVVLWDGDISVATLGGGAPKGLCGSGLIDAVAVMLRAGILDRTGRLHDSGPLSARVVMSQEAVPMGFSLAPGVVLTQKDIRAFQLAKGAIRAACELLLRHAGISAGAVKDVFLAGAFGSAVSADNVLSTGMLPPVHPSSVTVVGNAALAGAEMMALSAETRETAERIAKLARHVDLSTDPSFQDEFLQSLDFHMAMPQGTR